MEGSQREKSLSMRPIVQIVHRRFGELRFEWIQLNVMHLRLSSIFQHPIPNIKNIVRPKMFQKKINKNTHRVAEAKSFWIKQQHGPIWSLWHSCFLFFFQQIPLEEWLKKCLKWPLSPHPPLLSQHHNGLGLGRKTQEQLASLRKVKTLRKRGLDKFSSPSLVLVKLLRFANLKVSGNAWEYCQLPSLVLKLGFFEWFLSLNNLGKAKMRPLQIAHVYACLVAGDNPEPGHTENRFLYYVNPFPMGSMYASMHLDSWFLW